MKKLIVLAVCLGVPITVAAQQNVSMFTPVFARPHPICGINPAFDGQPSNKAVPPFASCRTLATGFQSDESYPDPGKDALAKLLVAFFTSGPTWDQRMGPLSRPRLECRPPMAIGMGPLPGSPQAQLPVCTVSSVQSFLAKYNGQAIVQGFKKMESQINNLDLKQQSTIDKLKQAAAVTLASGGNVTFDDIAELLK